MQKKENYLTVKDVAKLLQLKEVTIRRMVWKKLIPFHKIGRSVRCVGSEIDNHTKVKPDGKEKRSNEKP